MPSGRAEGTGGREQVAIFQLEGETIPQADAEVDVRVERTADRLRIVIEAVRSPALAKMIRGAGEPLPEDWRVLVQSVAIDPDYDGEVFRSVLTDVPLGKTEMVRGCYEIEAEAVGSTLCIHIVDVCGKESFTVLAIESGARRAR